jgi:hypothetical protein
LRRITPSVILAGARHDRQGGAIQVPAGRIALVQVREVAPAGRDSTATGAIEIHAAIGIDGLTEQSCIVTRPGYFS